MMIEDVRHSESALGTTSRKGDSIIPESFERMLAE